MKNLSLIFLITLFLIVLINSLIAVSWPLYSKYLNKEHKYQDEHVEVLNMSQENLNILYNETWRVYDKFTYIPFVGHSETKRVGKYVNFDQKNGRKVIRPVGCKSNVYLYGGSTMFGYNVADKNTIAQELQNLLGDEYCVFNHGRAYYYSKQENNLLTQHIENKHQIDFAFFLDGINERCGGYEYDMHLYRSFQILIDRPYNMWKKTFIDFVYTLPVIQFFNSIQNKNRWIRRNIAESNVLEIEACKKNVPINHLFEKRLKLRHALCNEENIKCFSFLQPFAGIHGIQSEKFIKKERKEYLLKKHNLFKNIKYHLIDIGHVLDNDKTLSYVDGAHYTPSSNKKIAKEFQSFIN